MPLLKVSAPRIAAQLTPASRVPSRVRREKNSMKCPNKTAAFFKYTLL